MMPVNRKFTWARTHQIHYNQINWLNYIYTHIQSILKKESLEISFIFHWNSWIYSPRMNDFIQNAALVKYKRRMWWKTMPEFFEFSLPNRTTHQAVEKWGVPHFQRLLTSNIVYISWNDAFLSVNWYALARCIDTPMMLLLLLLFLCNLVFVV